MIESFGSRETEWIWRGEIARKIPREIQPLARRKLRMIHRAQVLDDLRIPPGNKLKRLSGKLAGYHAFRINRQWRIIFIWTDEGVHDVQITDYH